eukprot:TRINITY_DN4012_c0_g1_i2.p1 TRINITY_DN4012_c0_g1~~TRINITY_DN4012_c0_g1_i2.p1  ORF type:complete len:247 (+),score=108.38 TRINITY_DN4012_c0_g1_i2:45-785(+)
MSNVLAGGNVEEEYLWSCTLSGSNKEFSWEPSSLEPPKKEGETGGTSVKPGHRLLIKTAILSPTAKENEVTVVEIESEGYNHSKVTVPICAMRGGSDLQKYVDLLVPGPAKLKIIHGEGPINLVGSHCVDYYGMNDDDDDTDEDEDDEEADEMETEEATEETKAKNKSGDKKSSPAKDAKEEAKKPSPEKAEKKSTQEKTEAKKATPEKTEAKKATPEKKVTPAKEESKKRKASGDPKSAEKKAKN